jgi:hypothetical protein
MILYLRYCRTGVLFDDRVHVKDQYVTTYDDVILVKPNRISRRQYKNILGLAPNTMAAVIHQHHLPAVDDILRIGLRLAGFHVSRQQRVEQETGCPT